MRSTFSLLLIVGVAAPATAQVFFEGTGVEPGRNSFRVHRLSADGRFIVGRDNRPMRWSRDLGFEFLGSVSPAGTGTAEGVSSDGQWVVGYSWVSGNPPVAFRWSPATGILHLPFPAAIDVSSSGHYVVGDAFINAVSQAVRWSSVAGLEPLGVPAGAERTLSHAASADASVVVGLIDYTGHERAFRWSAAGGMEDLGTLPGQLNSIARGVSADGKVVLGASSARAFRWTRAHGMQDIAPSIAGAFDVSDDGWRVIGSQTSPSKGGAFIWDPVSGSRLVKEELLALGLVQVAEWELNDGIGISADGTIIAGSGRSPENVLQGWIARIPSFCYANCDGSTAPPQLNVADFACFLQKFAANDIYGNCNNDGFMDVTDFACYLQKFAAGCP